MRQVVRYRGPSVADSGQQAPTASGTCFSPQECIDLDGG